MLATRATREELIKAILDDEDICDKYLTLSEQLGTLDVVMIYDLDSATVYGKTRDLLLQTCPQLRESLDCPASQVPGSVAMPSVMFWFLVLLNDSVAMSFGTNCLVESVHAKRIQRGRHTT